MECTFVDFMFTPVSRPNFDAIHLSFPFLLMVHSVELSVGELLLALVFSHNIFQCPNLGVLRQKIGVSMGTNCAPAWANLVLRAYEHSLISELPTGERDKWEYMGHMEVHRRWNPPL